MTIDTNTMAQTGCFVSVHVKRPSLRSQLSWQELGLAEIDGLVSAPSAKPPSGKFSEFSKWEGRMRTILKNHTAGSEHGFRFMKYSQWDAFLAQVEPVRQTYLDLVEPFLDEYDEAKRAALMEWDTKAADIYYSLRKDAVAVDRDTFVSRLISKLRRAWPNVEDLRTRFDAEIKVLQFAIPGEEQVVSPLMIKEARERARSTLDSFFMEAQGELRARAVEKMARIRDVLKNGETVTEKSLKPLREFVAQFQALSVIPDAEFHNAMSGLVTEVDRLGGAKGLRDNRAAWSSFGALVEETTTLGERLANEALGRKLDLSDRKIAI